MLTCSSGWVGPREGKDVSSDARGGSVEDRREKLRGCKRILETRQSVGQDDESFPRGARRGRRLRQKSLRTILAGYVR